MLRARELLSIVSAKQINSVPYSGPCPTRTGSAWRTWLQPAGERKRAAQMLGQRGGKARAKVLSAERRKEIAQKGAEARWKS
jgi:hypothetical protein